MSPPMIRAANVSLPSPQRGRREKRAASQQVGNLCSSSSSVFGSIASQHSSFEHAYTAIAAAASVFSTGFAGAVLINGFSQNR